MLVVGKAIFKCFVIVCEWGNVCVKVHTLRSENCFWESVLSFLWLPGIKLRFRLIWQALLVTELLAGIKTCSPSFKQESIKGLWEGNLHCNIPTMCLVMCLLISHIFFPLFKTGRASCHIVQAALRFVMYLRLALKVLILLPLPSQCWD